MYLNINNECRFVERVVKDLELEFVNSGGNYSNASCSQGSSQGDDAFFPVDNSEIPF